MDFYYEYTAGLNGNANTPRYCHVKHDLVITVCPFGKTITKSKRINVDVAKMKESSKEIFDKQFKLTFEKLYGELNP